MSAHRRSSELPLMPPAHVWWQAHLRRRATRRAVPVLERPEQCALVPVLPSKGYGRQAAPLVGRLEAQPSPAERLRHPLDGAAPRAWLDLEDLPASARAIDTAAHRHGPCGVWAGMPSAAIQYMHRPFLSLVACVTLSACSRSVAPVEPAPAPSPEPAVVPAPAAAPAPMSVAPPIGVPQEYRGAYTRGFEASWFAPCGASFDDALW